MESNQLNFTALLQAIHSPLLVVDTDFNIVAANSAYENVSGVSFQNLQGRKVFEVFPDNPNDPHANGVENLTASFHRVLKFKAPDPMPIQKYDVPIAGSENGAFEERYWVSINAPLLDSHGNITHILHRVEEVTEQVLSKHRESKLAAKITEQLALQSLMAASEAQAREIANNLPMIVWTARPDGYVDWYNDWWYEYLGQPRGTEWDDPEKLPMHPDDVLPTIEVWNECLRTGNFYTIEQRFRRASDGQYRWHIVRGIPIRDEHGNITKWIGGNTDIHDAKCLAEELNAAKQELEEKSKLLETVLLQMPHAVVIADAKGKLIFSNPQIEKVWRHSLIDSQNIEDYAQWIGFDKDGRRYEGKDWPMARSLINGEVVVNEDTNVLLGDGTRGVMRLSSAPVRNTQGEIIAGVILCEDVTEKIQSVEELKSARLSAEMANEAKSYFLANMSHEIRTPLGAILGFSSLLKERNLDPVEGDHYVDTILRNGNALTRIIDDILDLAKVEAGKLETEEVPFSLFQLATEVMDLFKDKIKDKGIYLVLNMDESVPFQICSDPTRIRQILVNIVGNAVKFTEKGGVRVSIRSTQTGDGKNEITIDVKDTGIGLSREQKEKLFKPFTQADNSMTRKFGGTGLGLALSQRLSQALAGDISIAEGNPGEGCTFTLRFIANPAQGHGGTKIRTDTARPQVNSLKGVRVLVVDDSQDNQFLVARLLKRNGADVETAQDGDEGIHKALSGSYDIVLMDIQMPRMDGYQAKQALDRRGYEKPVIALTAHAMKDERLKTEAAGFAGHLTKPLVGAELLKTVASCRGRTSPPARDQFPR